MFERFGSTALRVVALAEGEARTLRHNYVGTEHILMGLAEEAEGVAARILHDFGADQAEIRRNVIQALWSARSGTG